MTNELPKTADSLPIALIRAREVLMEPVREMLSEVGITEQQWRILRVLEEGGAMDARAVAKGAALSAPSLSRILPTLEARGMISRKGNPEDRRRQIVQIEATGRDLISVNRSRAHDLASESRDRLGPQKYSALLDLLGEISAWKDNR